MTTGSYEAEATTFVVMKVIDDILVKMATKFFTVHCRMLERTRAGARGSGGFRPERLEFSKAARKVACAVFVLRATISRRPWHVARSQPPGTDWEGASERE